MNDSSAKVKSKVFKSQGKKVAKKQAGSHREVDEDPLDSIRGLSPSSSTHLQIAQHAPVKKRFRIPENIRPSSPVTIVGFQAGIPRGLHITGSKSPEQLSLYANFLSRDTKVSDWNDKLEGSKGATKQTTKMKEATVFVSSPLPEDLRAKSKRLNSVKRLSAAGQLDKIKIENRKLKVPIAPWKELSVFQSPAEHKRQTFNSFKVMSPDPPKTPVNVASRIALKGRTSRTNALRDPRDDLNVLGSSMNAAKWTNREDRSKWRNIDDPSKWTSREDNYLNSSDIASSSTNTSRRRGHTQPRGRSTTGLSIARSLNNETIMLKKAPSYTNNSGKAKKFTTISPAQPNVTSNKSMVINIGNNSSADSGPSVGQNQGVISQWNSILQTNPIPMPPSKRLEQARRKAYIMHGDYNGHEAASARVEARAKYSNPVYQPNQRFNNGPANANSTSPNPVVTPTSAGSSSGHSASKQKIKPQLLPPVHIPGPKRENIYIGHYDGSDSDSDKEDTAERKH